MDDQRKHEIMEVARQKRLLKAQRRKPPEPKPEPVETAGSADPWEAMRIVDRSMWQRIMGVFRGE